jgi:hypothetical protein
VRKPLGLLCQTAIQRIGDFVAGQEHMAHLMSPDYVNPYVKAQKNDVGDAGAIAACHPCGFYRACLAAEMPSGTEALGSPVPDTPWRAIR